MAEKQLGLNPSNTKDTATKTYVDSAVSSGTAPFSGFQSVTTAAGTTTLTSSSPMMTQFTGSTTQTCVLPDATTLSVGRQFILSNRSTGSVQVNMNGGSALQTLFSTSEATLTLTANGTAAGTWDVVYLTTGGSVGTAATAYVATSESTTSTTYTDLTTTTDTVTVTIGSSGMAIVFISGHIEPTGYGGFICLTASGANTIAASDVYSIYTRNYNSGSGYYTNFGSPFLLTGLTAGSTTFKLKYKADNSSYSVSFKDRRVSVIPINNTNLWAGLTNNLEGSFSALPAAGTAGRMYTATDTGLALMDNGSSWDRISISKTPSVLLGAVPTTGWTGVNVGSSTFASDKDGMLFTVPSGGSGFALQLRTLTPSSNYTATFYIDGSFPIVSSWQYGVILAQSSGSMIFFGPFYSTTFASTMMVEVDKWTSPTAYSAHYNGYPAMPNPNVNWWRLRDDGTNRYFEFSYNGIDWITHYSVSRTDFITPNQIGIGASNSSGATGFLRLRSLTGVS